MKTDTSLGLAQSASALGAGIPGFGLGVMWGFHISAYARPVIITGAFLHLYGMYVMQMRNKNERRYGTARIPWISAWICLLALAVIIIYFILNNR
jgi:hypothetical protein